MTTIHCGETSARTKTAVFLRVFQTCRTLSTTHDQHVHRHSLYIDHLWNISARYDSHGVFLSSCMLLQLIHFHSDHAASESTCITQHSRHQQ
jgi:hypothetical protein